MKFINTGVFGIKVELEGKHGTIKSDLKEKMPSGVIEEQYYNAGIDGIEAMILAHACTEIDITTPAYLEGIEVAVEALTNEYS